MIRRAQAMLPQSNADDVKGEQIAIARIRSQILQGQGDLEGAVAETGKQFELALQFQSDQHLLLGDISEQLGVLRLTTGDLDGASEALEFALRLRGGEGA